MENRKKSAFMHEILHFYKLLFAISYVVLYINNSVSFVILYIPIRTEYLMIFFFSILGFWSYFKRIECCVISAHLANDILFKKNCMLLMDFFSFLFLLLFEINSVIYCFSILFEFCYQFFLLCCLYIFLFAFYFA